MLEDYTERWILPSADGSSGMVLYGGLTEIGQSDSMTHGTEPVRMTARLLLRNSPGLCLDMRLRRERDGAVFLVTGEEEHAPRCCSRRLSCVRVEKLVPGVCGGEAAE